MSESGTKLYVDASVTLSATEQALLRACPHTDYVQVLESIGEGVSGARVLLVNMRFHGKPWNVHDGPNFVKIDRLDRIEAEARKFEQARDGIEAFVPALLPVRMGPLDDPASVQPYAGLIYSPAGESTLSARSLGKMVSDPRETFAPEMIAGALRRLNTSVLACWNDSAAIRPLGAQAYVLYRLALNTATTDRSASETNPLALPALAKRDSEAAAMGVRVLGDQAHQSHLWVNEVDEALPNPVVYLAEKARWPNAILSGPFGRIHGDLHGGNLLCRIDAYDKATGVWNKPPWLIDFARSESEALIFFDLAYLELDLLLRRLGDKPWPEWKSLLATAADLNLLSPNPPGPAHASAAWRCIVPVRERVEAIIGAASEALKDQYRATWWLAASAVGVLFARRSSYIGARESALALLYAMYMLKRAMSLLNMTPGGSPARVDLTSSYAESGAGGAAGPALPTLPTTMPDTPVWLPIPPLRQILIGDHELPNAPEARIDVTAFLMARTPVTQRQYARFVRLTGHPPPVADSEAFRWSGQNPPKDKRDHPVVMVTAADAEAYCRWLNEELRAQIDARFPGWQVRLPSEAQWEAAARGSDGRPYPWGKVRPTPELCNFDGDSRFPDGTSPVEAFPDGKSPFGCLDMAGNVWEWTRGTVDGLRALRGGSWEPEASQDTLRAASRRLDDPHAALDIYGFRVCLCSGE